MSDHPEAPVTPLAAPEPSYYLAVFSAVRTEDQSGFGETNARMEAGGLTGSRPASH
ncbi:hypothetical protein [Streptomyces sp. NBC_00028]|uniref:hypothetical protein n=1 Tax=Streptomyces sp. NBC_00028 TaxID=2975624 RepID=UPI00386CF401